MDKAMEAQHVLDSNLFYVACTKQLPSGFIWCCGCSSNLWVLNEVWILYIITKSCFLYIRTYGLRVIA